jgi:alkylation response protein AidB-like acyl-CoA dehydrogenase
MDVRFTEEQELLRTSVRDVLARECPMSAVRDTMERPQGFSDELWKAMAGLGWTGLAVPRSCGGAGLGLVDLCVVLEEMGRVLAPGPFFSSVALGGLGVALAGSPTQRERFLPGVAAGTLRVTLAQLEENGSWGPDGIRAAARRTDGEWRLSGAKLFVPDAHVADLLMVPALTPDAGAEGVTLFLADAHAAGVEIRPMAFTDATRRYAEVRFSESRVADDAVLGEIGHGWVTLEGILDRAKVALCAEMCGGAARVLELSVEYAKTREQFGRPIGSFQAIAHKCADMLVRLEGSRSATYYAAWALDQEQSDAHVAACMAKAYCSDAYREVAGEGIQIHGGLGFTWEQDLHLYYKRAKGSEVTFGDATWNRELVARALIDRTRL